MTTPALDVDYCRTQFPSLKDNFLFADNAGGSQCLKSVADKMSDYLIYTNVQIGANYSVSVTSKQRINEGFASMAKLVNAKLPSEMAVGHSSTNLSETLSQAMEPTIESGDEIIVSDVDHETNIGCWVRLAERKGLKLHHWVPKAAPGSTNPYAVSLHLDDLIPMLNQNTRLVAFPACSNVLGDLVDVEGIVKVIRERTKSANKERGAEVCIDSVAYAPHRRMDVQKWDVDYLFISYYKFYGPHCSALYTRAESHHKLASLAHYFLPVHEGSPYKLQPGGVGYERSYAVTAVLEYLESLGGDLDSAFASIIEHAGKLLRPMMDCLLSPEMQKRGVRVLGPESADPNIRIPTVSFVVVGDSPMRSSEVVKHFDALGDVGTQAGSFYAQRLFTRLGLDPENGAVRISLVHYNTVAESERLAKRLKEVLL